MRRSMAVDRCKPTPQVARRGQGTSKNTEYPARATDVRTPASLTTLIYITLPKFDIATRPDRTTCQSDLLAIEINGYGRVGFALSPAHDPRCPLRLALYLFDAGVGSVCRVRLVLWSVDAPSENSAAASQCTYSRNDPNDSIKPAHFLYLRIYVCPKGIGVYQT